MEILSVYDSAFKPYGRVVEGYPTEGLVKALATTPCTDGVVYLPRVEVLHCCWRRCPIWRTASWTPRR